MNCSDASDGPSVSEAVQDIQLKETLKRIWATRAAEDAADIAFAESVGAIVTEGPWENVPAIRVAYVGVTLRGDHVTLEAIPSFWRYQPPRIGSLTIHHGEGQLIAWRVYLGREIPGALVGIAGGIAPVQAYGLVDGKEFYFRSRGDSWQMQIGDADVIRTPEWFYQENYGTWPEAGGISEDQAYNFIEKAIEHFRSGLPTMVREL
ncbi:hypothetical protein [Pararhizobium sp.]|uniref:hypothetical protein n=1 Tax=Pararhizobium sp. TaxID=1977563 RepID=UPI003D0D3A89